MQKHCQICQHMIDVPFGYPFCNNEDSNNYYKNLDADKDCCKNFELKEGVKLKVKFGNKEIVRKDKTSEVLKHLKVKGSITSMEAIKLYGATRLSAIIFNLRKKGYDIVTHNCETIDRYGHTCTFAKYVLKED